MKGRKLALVKRMKSDVPLTRLYNSVWKDWSGKEDIQKEIERRRQVRRPFHELIERCLKILDSENPKILEVGCGTGIDALSPQEPVWIMRSLY